MANPWADAGNELTRENPSTKTAIKRAASIPLAGLDRKLFLFTVGAPYLLNHFVLNL
jgi:hypothetical protein